MAGAGEADAGISAPCNGFFAKTRSRSGLCAAVRIVGAAVSMPKRMVAGPETGPRPAPRPSLLPAARGIACRRHPRRDKAFSAMALSIVVCAAFN